MGAHPQRSDHQRRRRRRPGLDGQRRLQPHPGPSARCWSPEKGGCCTGWVDNLACEGEGIGRSRGGPTSKVHLVVDGRGLPISIQLTPGQAGDHPQLLPLLEHIAVPRPAPGASAQAAGQRRGRQSLLAPFNTSCAAATWDRIHQPGTGRPGTRVWSRDSEGWSRAEWDDHALGGQLSEQEAQVTRLVRQTGDVVDQQDVVCSGVGGPQNLLQSRLSRCGAGRMAGKPHDRVPAGPPLDIGLEEVLPARRGPPGVDADPGRCRIAVCSVWCRRRLKRAMSGTTPPDGVCAGQPSLRCPMRRCRPVPIVQRRSRPSTSLPQGWRLLARACGHLVDRGGHRERPGSSRCGGRFLAFVSS